MTSTTTEYIALDQNGVAWIEGANVKVLEVVVDHQGRGWSPEEIHFQHPHLSLAQIHAALSYYYSHRATIDQQIQSRREEAQRLRANRPPTPIDDRLRDLKTSPAVAL
jgi:uncharacterized protein (DUF433 family)